MRLGSRQTLGTKRKASHSRCLFYCLQVDWWGCIAACPIPPLLASGLMGCSAMRINPPPFRLLSADALKGPRFFPCGCVASVR